jgi:hypothetical protein
MLDPNTSLAGIRAAVTDLLAVADGAAASWTTPRAPGKWSPSQVVEHVARLMDESTKVVTGAPSGFPKIPIFVRPFLRLFFFRRTLRKNVFPTMKAIPAFDPASGSATPSEARVRLEGALRRFDQACRARAASGQDVKSTIFGPVSVADFAKFQELHVRHHRLQMPGAA